jgi:hypothetical protein
VNPLRFVVSLMGLLAAVLAIARNETTLVWVAIGLLGSSLGIRLVQKFQSRRDGDDDSTSLPD